MSWEIVTLLSVLAICFTVFLCISVMTVEQEKPSPISADEFELLKTAVGAVKSEHEVIHKLAEDTKKLLSQQNLVQSLRGPR